MTIVIPIWLIWIVGIAFGIVILLLAIVGAMFLWQAKDWRPFR